MGDLIMDIINGSGYLLIPGFLALFLPVFRYVKPIRLAEAKAAVLQHVKIRK
jgi:hypothetical protein